MLCCFTVSIIIGGPCIYIGESIYALLHTHRQDVSDRYHTHHYIYNTKQQRTSTTKERCSPAPSPPPAPASTPTRPGTNFPSSTLTRLPTRMTYPLERSSEHPKHLAVEAERDLGRIDHLNPHVTPMASDYATLQKALIYTTPRSPLGT